VVDQATAFAEFQTDVSATFGDAFSSVHTVSDAVATLDGFAASEFAVTLNTNGYATGFNLFNGGPGSSSFIVVADKFQVQLPGFNGDTPYGIFTTGTVNGVPSVGINGDLFVDGSITALALNVGNLGAISANLGTVTTGKIQSPSGKFIIDANNERIEIWS